MENILYDKLLNLVIKGFTIENACKKLKIDRHVIYCSKNIDKVLNNEQKIELKSYKLTLSSSRRKGFLGLSSKSTPIHRDFKGHRSAYTKSDGTFINHFILEDDFNGLY